MFEVGANMKRLAGAIFVVEVQKIAPKGRSLTHLDLTVSLEGSAVSCNPTLEKHVTPLQPNSAHAPSVHSAWVHGLCHRVHKLSDKDSATHNLGKLFRK